jgi:hypothetical protein
VGERLKEFEKFERFEEFEEFMKTRMSQVPFERFR